MSVPPRIRALNKVLPKGLGRFSLSSADALESAARQSTGRQAELSPDSREALQQLLLSYADTAQLHPLGEIMSAVNVLSLLKHQLRLNAALNLSPTIANRRITAPLIITGLPRTGSTLLHNLLALDPHWRVPVSWEVTQPAPLAETRRTQRARIALTQLRFFMIEALNPGFRAIHELDAHLPQECLVITAAALRSHLFFSSAFVPGYQDWLDAQPQNFIFDQHKLFLQYLQRSPDTNWALKAPSHLFSIDGLLAAYPDARLVHTKRAPEEVVGSIASLQWHLYRTFSNFDDRHELGRQVCSRWGHAHRAFSQRLANSRELTQQTFVLDYPLFIEDPVAQIKSLYSYFDLQLSSVAQANMRGYLRKRPQHRFGKHNYNLADYGLTAQQVHLAFEE